MLGFLFVAAWAASDSIFMALLAVGLFVGILLMTVIDNLAVQKQQFTPFDDGATIYQAPGLDADAEVRDAVNRPWRLSSGQVIRPLFG